MPKPTKKKVSVEVRQHRAMWKLVNENCGEEEFRTWIFDLTGGKESSSDLTFEQKNQVIRGLGGTPFTKSRQKPAQNVTNMGTPWQKTYLHDLWFKYAHRTANGLEILCNNTIKKPKPITKQQFSDMIEAVKRMNRGEAAKQQEAA